VAGTDAGGNVQSLGGRRRGAGLVR
jgi:hypothetical protein